LKWKNCTGSNISMTQEEKQLLLNDLCARLPYGVIIAYKEGKNDYHCWTLRTLNAPGISKSDTAPDSDGEIEYTEQAGIGTRTGIRPLRLEKMLPYLRPMSSMTEEEKKEYHKQVDIDLDRTAEVLREQFEAGTFHPENKFTPQYCHIDWLNAHHFDFRGLIPMGLALEAPEGMYKTE